MTRRSRPSPRDGHRGSGPSAGGWLALVLAVLGLAAAWVFVARSRVPEPAAAGVSPAPPPAPPRPPPSAFQDARFPTGQDVLRDPASPGVFQPTAAGNPTSALYGSVRSTQVDGRLMASFHEGVDIAPLQRDARGRALDSVQAVAAGRVGYANRLAGNSNYGNYVVLLHDDPLGEVYTLYAHLAEVAAGVRAGQPVAKGAVLGRLGNTPTTIIPLARSHVHFEVGLVLSTRFDRWFRAQRLKPDHGIFNGWNLLAVDPRGFFKAQQGSADFEMQDYLGTVPVAFEVVAAAPAVPDYFRRYPRLWQGASYTGGHLRLACSENGVVLGGRTATPDEARLASPRRAAVVKADPVALGRNGARLVVKDGAAWRLGRSGERWLEILLYP